MKTLNLWTSNIQVIDNFIEDQALYSSIKNEQSISNTVEGQNKNKLTDAQSQVHHMVTLAVINYCAENHIDFNLLNFGNLQRGCLRKYDESMVSNHLYEPHHDIAEAAYITAIYYIDSSYKEDGWCGGELTIYKHLTFVDYPQNIVNILPKQNRLIIFPGFLTHRVKPYFGDVPRTSLVFGWKADNTSGEALTI